MIIGPTKVKACKSILFNEGIPEAEIVETTLVIFRFCFLRVGSRISELGVIIAY